MRHGKSMFASAFEFGGVGPGRKISAANLLINRSADSLPGKTSLKIILLLLVRGEEGVLFCGTLTQGSSYVVRATLG
jgi:hypothetical protein